MRFLSFSLIFRRAASLQKTKIQSDFSIKNQPFWEQNLLLNWFIPVLRISSHVGFRFPRLWYFWEGTCEGLCVFCAWRCPWLRDSASAPGLLLHVGVCAYHLCPAPAGRLVSLHASRPQTARDQDLTAGGPAWPPNRCQGHMNRIKLGEAAHRHF